MRKDFIPSLVIGTGFFLVGSIWLLSNLFNWDINFNYIWPFFLITPGLVLWGTFIVGRGKDWGLVIPATILTSLGLTFMLNAVLIYNLDIQSAWAVTSFMYPGSVALAFWLAWIASGRKQGLMIVAIVLSVVTLFTFCSTSLIVLLGESQVSGVNRFFWPFASICAGVFILMSPVFSVLARDSKRSEHATQEKSDWKSDAQEAEVIGVGETTGTGSEN